MLTLNVILLLLAAICFFVGAFRLTAKYNVDPVALGLFLATLTLLVA
jgi:hypothetical protein